MTASAAPIRGVDRSRIAAIVLALVGLADSAYLAYVKLTNQLASCSNLGDCETVNSSRYSEIGGVPIALLGAAAYLIILGAGALDQPGSRWGGGGSAAHSLSIRRLRLSGGWVLRSGGRRDRPR